MFNATGEALDVNKFDRVTGNVIQARIKQSVNGLTTKVDKFLIYDTQGRLKKVSQKIDGDNVNNTVDLVEFEYDELGRVHHKKIHNQAEKMVYAYDVAGRLNSFTSSKFSYNIGYDQMGGLTEAKPFYGGNISYMSWQNGSTSKKAFRLHIIY